MVNHIGCRDIPRNVEAIGAHAPFSYFELGVKLPLTVGVSSISVT